MKFAAALSTKTDWHAALTDLGAQLQAQLPVARTDLLAVFVHPHYLPVLDGLLAALRQLSGARHLIGCTGAAVLAGQTEVEQQPAIAVLAGLLPGVELQPLAIPPDMLDESSGPEYWHFQTQTLPEDKPNFLLLAEPFSIHITRLVDELTRAFPGRPIAGGLASGRQQPGGQRLFLDDTITDTGAVCLALSGRLTLDVLVAQGCKPIGEPLTITRAERNVILELGGRPPLQVLQEMLPRLPAADQKLARAALLVGRVVDEYKEEFQRGDFVIRNLVGHDPQTGALAVGDVMRPGQTVQFQVRDRQAAAEDLAALLAQQQRRWGRRRPHGALLFSCLGRGRSMYGEPDHDSRAIQKACGPLPVAGCFCNGEIGPAGGKAFVHGFTSVVAFFLEPPSTATGA